MTELPSTTFIGETIEKPLFETTSSQKIFYEFCTACDSITPQFVDRTDLEEEDNVLVDNKEGEGKILLLPKDLRLSEVPFYLKVLYSDTYQTKPEKIEEKRKQLKQLGLIFEKGGIYISKYLSVLPTEDEKETARSISQRYYQYGLSLQSDKERRDKIPEDADLTNEEKDMLDEWFLGEILYKSRLERLGENPTEEQKEKYRKKVFVDFFKILTQGDRTGFGRSLQRQIRKNVIKEIETPKIELEKAIFKRGVEMLVLEMKESYWKGAINHFLEKMGYNPFLEEKRLYDKLDLDKEKRILQELRKIGNIEEISAKEMEVAKKIYKGVKSFKYQGDSYTPTKMLKTQLVGCLGASLLGGALLEEMGIRYLSVSVPNHSTTILITSDGKKYWQDFTPYTIPLPETIFKHFPGYYTEITPEMLERGSLEKDFKESEEILVFKDFKPYLHIKGKLKVGVSSPEIGLQVQMYNNISSTLAAIEDKKEGLERVANMTSENFWRYEGIGEFLVEKGYNREAARVFMKLVDIDPEEFSHFFHLNTALIRLGYDREVLDMYEKLTSIYPDQTSFYQNLAYVHELVGNWDAAIKVYERGIKNCSENSMLYAQLAKLLILQGRTDEAIRVYMEGVKNNPKADFLYENLAQSLLLKGDIDGAIRVRREGVKISPVNVSLREGLVNLLKSKGDLSEAAEICKQGIRNNPKNTSFYFLLTSLLHSLGRPKEAERMRRRGEKVLKKNNNAKPRKR